MTYPQDEPQPEIPLGNLEPAQLARLIAEDFAVAWDAMATCSREPRVGGHSMFARQAFSYLELAALTASSFGNDAYLGDFAQRLRERDRRYFTPLPGAVPLPSGFRLPAVAGVPPERQLLAALFDMSRHGLAHIYQQTPVDLSDDKQWITTFTGTEPHRLMRDVNGLERRRLHLAYRMGPREGRVYLIVCPDVLMADLEWAAGLAAIFSQYLAPDYPARPRKRRRRAKGSITTAADAYDFTTEALVASLDQAGHSRLAWPAPAPD